MRYQDTFKHGLYYDKAIQAALHPRDDHFRGLDCFPFDHHIRRLGSFGMAATQEIEDSFLIHETKAFVTVTVPSAHER
jgi:hypothetical protein